jgi:hypothetical protein
MFMKTVWMLLVLCVSALCIPGCASSQRSPFGLNGLPKEQYRVGGGVQIEYEVLCNGVCYLVDTTSGKFLVTETHSAGDIFEFSLPDNNDDQLSPYKSLINSLTKAKIVLYFVPLPEEKEQEQK